MLARTTGLGDGPGLISTNTNRSAAATKELIVGALKPWHIIVVVVIIMLLFGAQRLPDLARSIGQSLKIFKDEVKDLASDGKAPTQTDSSVVTDASAESVPTPVSQPDGSLPPRG